MTPAFPLPAQVVYKRFIDEMVLTIRTELLDSVAEREHLRSTLRSKTMKSIEQAKTSE